MVEHRERGIGSAAPAREVIAQMHRAILDGVPAVTYRCRDDDDASTIFMSPQAEEALGYPVGEWLEQPDMWVELLHPDDRERVLAMWDRSRYEGIVFDAEYRLIGADGRRVWLHDRARRTIGTDGTPVWNGVMMDITAARAREERLDEQTFFLGERVKEQQARIDEADALIDLEVAERHAIEADLARAERRLAELKARLRSSWMYTWDVVDGRATGGFSDEATLIEFGADAAEAAVGGGEYWRTYIHPADVERVFERIRRSTTEGVPFEDSYRWVTPDGRVRWMLDRALPTRWDPATKRGEFIGLMVDVSDLMEGTLTPEA